MYTLRPYQREGVDAAWRWIRTCIDPCDMRLGTGAGKSLMIAELARLVREATGKAVLCTAPSKELVEQNAEKYRLTGEKCSLFSAAAGQKSVRHDVVFGTPITIKNGIRRFTDRFGLVVIDECHGITPTIRAIIDAMREANPRLRVVGLTATPFRLNEGYIHRIHADGSPAPNRDAYFAKCVYEIRERALIDAGYLTPPICGAIGASAYDTSGLVVNKMGKFDSAAVDRAFLGHGRLTSQIIADVIQQSRGRNGVMIFAATVQHAHEVMASLPPELSRVVTGETGKAERERIVSDFKAMRFKYLVNVGVFTTGFDATHVDVIALLRRTESASLLQQIVGRGARLHDGKENFLILDYAGNIDNHCPDGDPFSPHIKDVTEGTESGEILCKCDQCGGENVFAARPNPGKLPHDDNGYFVDLAGNRMPSDSGKPIPAHMGRRCCHEHVVAGRSVRCNGRWSDKECPECGESNDIAARYCTKCRHELVDPNEKLQIEFKRFKADPRNRQTDVVEQWTVESRMSQAGNPQWRIEWVTPYRQFVSYHLMEPTSAAQLRVLDRLKEVTGGFEYPPKTITYKKEGETQFYRVVDFNLEPDREPEQIAR